MGEFLVDSSIRLTTSELENAEGNDLKPLLMELLEDESQVDTLITSLENQESLSVIASKLSNTTYEIGSRISKQGNRGDWCNNLFFNAQTLQAKHLPNPDECWCRSYDTGYSWTWGYRKKNPHVNGKTLLVTEEKLGGHKVIQEVKPSRKFTQFAILGWRDIYYLAMVGLDDEDVWKLWVAELTNYQNFPHGTKILQWYVRDRWAFGYNDGKCNQTLGGFFGQDFLLFKKNSTSKTLNFPQGALL